MPVIWGIIVMLVMYVVIPVALIGGTLALLGGGSRSRRAESRAADPAGVIDPRHPPASGR